MSKSYENTQLPRRALFSSLRYPSYNYLHWQGYPGCLPDPGPTAWPCPCALSIDLYHPIQKRNVSCGSFVMSFGLLVSDIGLPVQLAISTVNNTWKASEDNVGITWELWNLSLVLQLLELCYQHRNTYAIAAIFEQNEKAEKVDEERAIGLNADSSS